MFVCLFVFFYILFLFCFLAFSVRVLWIVSSVTGTAFFHSPRSSGYGLALPGRGAEESTCTGKGYPVALCCWVLYASLPCHCWCAQIGGRLTSTQVFFVELWSSLYRLLCYGHSFLSLTKVIWMRSNFAWSWSRGINLYRERLPCDALLLSAWCQPSMSLLVCTDWWKADQHTGFHLARLSTQVALMWGSCCSPVAVSAGLYHCQH